MSTKESKLAQLDVVLGAAPASARSQLVDRLLTPAEEDLVSGGDGYCMGIGGGGHQQSGGTYTQNGGSYTQSGSPYNMNCGPRPPGQP